MFNAGINLFDLNYYSNMLITVLFEGIDEA